MCLLGISYFCSDLDFDRPLGAAHFGWGSLVFERALILAIGKVTGLTKLEVVGIIKISNLISAL